MDPDLQDVYKNIMHSWYGSTAPDYFKFRYEKTIHDSLLYGGVRLLISRCLQQEMLEHLHDRHVGTDTMKSIARQCIWWPTIDSDIDHWAKPCEGCCKGKNHPKSMWTSWPEEWEKWSRVHVDLCGPFYDGLMALVMADAFAKWSVVHLLKSTTSNDIIKWLWLNGRDEPSLKKVYQPLWEVITAVVR